MPDCLIALTPQAAMEESVESKENEFMMTPTVTVPIPAVRTDHTRQRP
jgi:hypothetical protein